jgi:hypothetical protein
VSALRLMALDSASWCLHANGLHPQQLHVMTAADWMVARCQPCEAFFVLLIT